MLKTTGDILVSSLVEIDNILIGNPHVPRTYNIFPSPLTRIRTMIHHFRVDSILHISHLPLNLII